MSQTIGQISEEDILEVLRPQIRPLYSNQIAHLVRQRKGMDENLQGAVIGPVMCHLGNLCDRGVVRSIQVSCNPSKYNMFRSSLIAYQTKQEVNGTPLLP